MQRRKFLAALAVAALAAPAVAGHVVDNQYGRFNGTYSGKLKIMKPDAEDKIVERIKFDLEEKNVNVYLEDRTVRARLDEIYSLGFKTEITCHNPSQDERFVITIEKDFN